ncbi:MAG: TetR/AcrR family transcriptional regulator [Pseudodonghicola sp.]
MPKADSTRATKAQAAVRPKASKRKSRSPSVEHQARQPVQSRSLARFELILRTFDEMLMTSSIEDISFYDIAERAEVSPASISYLFPTMGALRVEALRRQLSHIAKLHEARRVQNGGSQRITWQEGARANLEYYRDYLHANRNVAEILMGPIPNQEIRRACIEENDKLAQTRVAEFEKRYILPPLPGLKQAFSYCHECVDTLWARSYAQEARITDEIFEATYRLEIAYLRTLLPEILTWREDVEGEALDGDVGAAE